MLLLIGNAGLSLCVARMRESLRDGKPARLLTPTTTMAEHLRNQLAREGFVFSPKLVSTFGRYVEELTPPMERADAATLEIIIAEVLEKVALKRYGAVREFAGFRTAVVRAAEEFSGAGGTPEALSLAGADPDFQAVFRAVLDELEVRKLYLRAQRLAAAAQAIADGPALGTLLLTGFSGLTPPELGVIGALSTRADLTVALTAESPAVPALRALASEVRDSTEPASASARVLSVANTLEEEATDIARRILTSGVPFRRIGVVLRSEQPYAAALRCAFERFGIAARFYFAHRLDQAPAVKYFRALVDAALSGWDHQTTLEALRMYGSPLERTFAGDKFDVAVRSRMPGQGLDSLREFTSDWVESFLEQLATLDAWRTAEATPAAWASHFAELPAFFQPPRVTDGVAHSAALLWREHSQAIQQFGAALSETAKALSGRVSCAQFLEALDSVIGATSVHPVDHRQDVVHVLDAMEARQWKLQLVFVPGMIEQHFPRYHSEDPILSDEVRKKLQAVGVPLKTSRERQLEERVLFDVSLECGDQQVILSYPRLNEKGEPNLKSFLLDAAQPYTEETAQAAVPVSLRMRAPEPYPSIIDPELRNHMVAEHQRISPSRIGRYVECRYGYFAESVLKLSEPPCGPWDRLNPLVQGNIAHGTFQLYYRDKLSLEDAFQRAYDTECRKNFVPAGYRTEAIRLELLDTIRAFVQKNTLPEWTSPKHEEDFEIVLTPTALTFVGRIDRIESDARGHALLIDYKYSVEGRVKSIVADHENRKAAQAGAYLLAARDKGYHPVGMVFCSVKDRFTSGWVREPYGTELGIKSSGAALEDLMISARELALQMVDDLGNGSIATQESGASECRRCSYLQICRAQTVAAPKVAQ